MRISTKGELSASGYADARLEMDAHIEVMRRELYEAADEKVRDWYQEGTARLFSRVPDASKERAANLYEAVRAKAEDSTTATGSEDAATREDAASSPSGAEVSRSSQPVAVGASLAGLSPSLLETPPPLNAVVIERGEKRGR